MNLNSLRKLLRTRIARRVRGALARRRRKIFIGLGIGLLISSVAPIVIRSWLAFLPVLAFLAAIAAGLAWETRRARRSARHARNDAAELRVRLASLKASQELLAASLYDQARSAGPQALEALPESLLPAMLQGLVNRGDALDGYALIARRQAWPSVDRAQLRRLRSELRRRGYLERALVVARLCVEREHSSGDLREVGLVEGEIAVLSGAVSLDVRPDVVERRPGRVLHVVGNSLPHTQSGYTLRTHYSALAQREAGLEPHVVTHMGFGVQGSEYLREDVDGITYHRVPGPVRGSDRLDVWLRTHVQRVANVVRVVRPSVLHAASDFLNAVTAQAVGRQFGIPVVYESRGFWEETWLSRQAEKFGWADLARLEVEHGLPDVYLWRRQIEDQCRRDADRVVTLAEVMADRIVAGGVDRGRIAVVPNGVDVGAFPVLTRDQGLAGRLGIGAATTVIGYISSIVEYEGIDTLVSAYAAVKESAPGPVMLLIVGDGLERERLMLQAAELGVQDVLFTGRVPHDAVLDYYSLIDVFVVPRKPVEVCHLVTPLKPFEAFSTGRTVVMSNVRALARIAEQSGAAELFEAGDPQSLAEVLVKLLHDPGRREVLAQAGATWVRAERTWTANALIYQAMYDEIVPPSLATPAYGDGGAIPEPHLASAMDALSDGIEVVLPHPTWSTSPETAIG